MLHTGQSDLPPEIYSLRVATLVFSYHHIRLETNKFPSPQIAVAPGGPSYIKIPRGLAYCCWCLTLLGYPFHALKAHAQLAGAGRADIATSELCCE